MKVNPVPGGYKLAEIKVQTVKPKWFWVGPDGISAEDNEGITAEDLGPGYRRVQVTDYHEDGTPVFPK